MKRKVTVQMNYMESTFRSDSVNQDDRTVELIWSTGAKGLRFGWDGKYYEELSMEEKAVDLSRLNDGSHPLLDNHDSFSLDSVIGVVERAWLENGIGKAKVRFAKTDRAERVYQQVRDKILRNVSIGYKVFEYTNVSNKGDEIPTFLATRYQPMEISIVPIGFDANAKVRRQELENECEVLHLTRGETATGDTMTKEEQLAQLRAEEAKRANSIRQAVKDAGLDSKLADEYIERGTDVAEATTNIKMFAKYAKEQTEQTVRSEVRVEVGNDTADKTRDGFGEYLLERILPGYQSKSQAANIFRGRTLISACEKRHSRYMGETDNQYMTRVQSTSDLPYLLANVAEKSIRQQFEAQPKTWSQWAKTDTLRNFKTNDLIRVSDFPSLEERLEGGEFKRGVLNEEREQVALKEYGKMMAFSRRMLINDDLGELVRMTSMAGPAAARLENQLVYEVLTGNPDMADGDAFFHANHSNLGTPGAISDTTFGELARLIRQQASLGGLDKLNLVPRFVICGPSEEMTARKYLATIQAAQASNVNPVADLGLQLVVDAEITNNDYFMSCSPSQLSGIVLYHLVGEESPRVESRVDFETESIEIKCAHSAVAKALEYKAMAKNANAS